MKLSHHAVATAQVGLSYLIVAGYLGVVVATGAKYLAADTASNLKDVLFLVATFWFQRQRASIDPTAPETK